MGTWALDKLQSLFDQRQSRRQLAFRLVVGRAGRHDVQVPRARDRKTDRIVGLKICDSEKTALFESRFKELNKPSEGEIAKSLRHPRIVETYEYGTTTKDQTYIVMEYVSGVRLAHADPAARPASGGQTRGLDPADGGGDPGGSRGRLHSSRRLPAEFHLSPRISSR